MKIVVKETICQYGILLPGLVSKWIHINGQSNLNGIHLHLVSPRLLALFNIPTTFLKKKQKTLYSYNTLYAFQAPYLTFKFFQL